jgi:MFS family permease
MRFGETKGRFVSATGQFRMLTLHYGLYQLAVAMALGFAGAYLIQGGLSLQQALSAYAALLTLRCLLRFAGLHFVRKAGYRRAVILGALLAALQFWPMSYANQTFGLLAWLFVIALAESLYWPVYHSAVAVTGVDGSRGRELGIRAAVGAIVAIVGPLTGGLLMQNIGAIANFTLGAAIMITAAIPLVLMRDFDAGPVPDAGQSLRNIDYRTFVVFGADGWMSAGMHLAWPMVLFVALDSNFEQMGFANALAGLAGAAGALLCGRAIDRGSRDKYLTIVSLALVCGLLLRALSFNDKILVLIANASTAAIMALYIPVIMSHVYDRAKTSGQAYRFHFVMEAAWDIGASTGCLFAALMVTLTATPSLAVLPALLGVLFIYILMRRQRLSSKIDHGNQI